MQEISYFFDSVRGEKELGDFKRRTKIERIKQVRLQEQEISKRLLKENLKKAEDLKKEKDKLYKYEEYLKKLQEIEQLNKLKEQNLIEIGNAHKIAKLSAIEHERLQREKHIKNKNYDRLTKERGKKALDIIQKEKNELTETKDEILRIKKAIHDQETLIAHEKAKEFRETNKQDKEIYEEEFFKVSNDKNLSKMKKRLDYKNTHFHNPMIQRHDLDSQKENAMENANREREILEVTFKERNEKERKIRDNSKKRGEKAYRKEKGLSQLKSFEHEIEKLTIFENKAKVQEDAKISVPIISKTMKHKQEKKRSEAELEKAFINKFSKKPPTPLSNSPKPKEFLRKKSSLKNLTHKLKRNLNKSLNNTINRDIERNKSLNLSKNEISPVKNSNLINNFFPLDSTERNNENNEENLDLSYKSLEKSHKSLEKSPNKSFEQSYKAINNEKVLNPDNSENLQDYIREQEAYLEKLEADRKNLKRKLQETSESPFENQLSPLDFIQNLHEKENSFINSHEYSQEKAQMLLEKFLGNEKTPKEGRIFKNNDNEERFNSTEGLIVRNSRRTPQKIEGTYIKTKETTPMSDLSYSISQDPSPEKSLKKRQISFESSLEKIKSNDRKEVFLEKSLENQVKDEKRELLFEKSFEKPDFSKKNEKELNYQESSKEEGLSLAEIFRRKKGKLIQKMEENKHENKEEFSRQRTEEFKTRTKEEILKLRKEMMKKPNFLKKNEKIDDIKEETTSDNVLRKNEKEGTVELMERLALGIKTKVGKKEMKALTNKNYEKLPEVKKKKEVEEKKNEFKKRQENAKKLEQRLRESLTKK